MRTQNILFYQPRIKEAWKHLQSALYFGISFKNVDTFVKIKFFFLGNKFFFPGNKKFKKISDSARCLAKSSFFFGNKKFFKKISGNAAKHLFT